MMQSHDLRIDEQSLITPALVKRHGKTTHEIDDSLLRQKLQNWRLFSNWPARVLPITSRGQGRRASGCQASHPAQSVGHDIWQKLIPLARRIRSRNICCRTLHQVVLRKAPRLFGRTQACLIFYNKHPAANDFIASCTELGREIYAYTSDAASSVAGREPRHPGPHRR